MDEGSFSFHGYVSCLAMKANFRLLSANNNNFREFVLFVKIKTSRILPDLQKAYIVYISIWLMVGSWNPVRFFSGSAPDKICTYTCECNAVHMPKMFSPTIANMSHCVLEHNCEC